MKPRTFNVLAAIDVIVTIVLLLILSVSCGSREPGYVVTKIHIPAGTPSSTGGVHTEKWFIHCKNAKTNLIKSIEVNKNEYDTTNVSDACDLNRGK
jgi:hypothetical protein